MADEILPNGDIRFDAGRQFNSNSLNYNLLQQTVGSHSVVYAAHHVIPIESYNASDFLRAAQRVGLWDQNNFSRNGVALVNKVDGITATIADQFGTIVATTAHTGGHNKYNAAQTGNSGQPPFPALETPILPVLAVRYWCPS